jgi:predicted phosphodiesterase
LKKEIKLPIPEGVVEIPLHPFEIKNAKSILFISDIHIPFYDKRALEIALSYGKGKDCIIIGGDLLDFAGLSRFRKRPDQLFIKEEVEIAKKFLKHLRELYPKARIIYYLGNHDLRFSNYINEKAPALYGLEVCMLESLLGLRNLRIEYIDNSGCMRVGSLYIGHGHEFGAGGGINVARSIMLKTFSNVVLGHFHRTQYTSIRDLDNKEKAVFSVACLCGLRPQWLPVNGWNNGFCEIEIFKDEFEILNRRILQDSYKVV